MKAFISKELNLRKTYIAMIFIQMAKKTPDTNGDIRSVRLLVVYIGACYF